jgi:hypothetical protein
VAVRTADKVRVHPSPERAVMLSAAFARARALALEPALAPRHGWQAKAVRNIRTTGGVAIDARGDDVSRGGFALALLPVRQEPVGASLVRIPVQQVRE